MNKTEKVKLHLIEKGSITPIEAYEEYGSMRLSDIIYRLRRILPIKTEKIIFTDRYGDKSYYAKYILEDNNAN